MQNFSDFIDDNAIRKYSLPRLKKMAARPTYLISTGIEQLFANRYGLNLSDITKGNVAKIESEFSDRLKEFLQPSYDYMVISNELVEGFMRELINRKNGLPIINLDDVLFNDIPVAGSVSVTRLVYDTNDFDRKVLGPRKGYPPLEYQLNKLAGKFKGIDIALMDNGIVNGETLLVEDDGLIPRLEKKGVNVKRIYVGIMNISCIPRFEEKGIEVMASKYYDFNNGDWIEGRDLLSFDGRKLDTKQYNSNNGAYLFARYTQDAETLKKGASIENNVLEVLDLCNIYQKKIVDELARDGYRVIGENGSFVYYPFTGEFNRLCEPIDILEDYITDTLRKNGITIKKMNTNSLDCGRTMLPLEDGDYVLSEVKRRYTGSYYCTQIRNGRVEPNPEISSELLSILNKQPVREGYYVEVEDNNKVLLLPRDISKGGPMNNGGIVCSIGDNTADIAMFTKSDFSGCPENAVAEVKSTADYVSPYEYTLGCYDILNQITKGLNSRYQLPMQMKLPSEAKALSGAGCIHCW